ncbi:hypothetical protein Slu03_26550 [Sediminihabitans luteus]|uniref:SCO7613 C-terminal domain-containing membrane protein n=1 Tax=Sediminihabitans luteus TaxID=1138585 RepID=UPI0019527740|nr:hypothetical protein [Sediminihabitans luteus]GIJ00278.1 hypothetical protein Slu03_26550 [Sediminihabitans luteus]
MSAAPGLQLVAALVAHRVLVVALLVAAPVAVAAANAPLGYARATVLVVVGAAWTILRDARTGLLVAGLGTVPLVLQEGFVPNDLALEVFGALVLVVGARRMLRTRAVGSWVALGPGLALVLGVAFVAALAAPENWRTALVVALAVAATATGAARRWQAPFVGGAVTTLVVVGIQVLPAIAAGIGRLDWWVVLAVGGAILLGLGITYEKRIAEARRATDYVTSMR